MAIFAIRKEWNDKKKYYSHTGYCIMFSYRLTIYLCQEIDMQNIIVNPGLYEFAISLAYTESSCFHNMENVAFYPMLNLLKLI